MLHCTNQLVGRALCVLLLGLVQKITEIEGTCTSPYYPSTHTACFDPSPYSTDPKGVTPTDQTTIVDEHNKLRASVDATDMQMMYWDNDLAFVAQKLAEKCIFEHDSDRGILCKYSTGQNLGLGHSSWVAVVQSWYSETSKFTYGSSAYVLDDIGHYTQVMWSKSAKVGCGTSFCSNLNQQIYVCNYAQPGNIPPFIPTPYTAGTKCSACPDRCNNGLCDCGGLLCKNGGLLDINTCTCTCKSPYQASADCNVNCNGAKDPGYCGKAQPYGYPPEFCTIYNNVPQECPVMCKICPGCVALQDVSVADLTTSSGGGSAAGAPVYPVSSNLTATRKPCKSRRR